MKLINPNFVDNIFWGGNGNEKTDDPLYSKWCSLLTEQYLKEDITILDYGCGCGRLANYISSKIENFTYYGLDTSWGYGQLGIECAKANYSDPRTHFGFIESNSKVISELEKEAIAKADLVVLGSVLTHLPLKSGLAVLRKFWPVLSRGRNVSLSAFWADKETFGTTISEDYYSHVIYSKDDIDNNLIYEETGQILAQGFFLHHIISIRKIKNIIKIL